MNFEAGRRPGWRSATRGVLAVLGTAALAGCASARPDVAPPAPRPEAAEPIGPSVERAVPRSPEASSVVSGEIRFIGAGAVPDLGSVAVGLLPRGIAGSPARAEPRPTLRVVSTTAEFRPATRIARPGQPIVLENRGPLVHRIFSPRLEDQVLPLPPGERSESFSLAESGPARFYCSLHADERFVLMVVSAPWAAVASGTGAYRFGPLPAGRYTLWIWSERISGPVRDIVVDGYSRSFEPIWLDPALIER